MLLKETRSESAGRPVGTSRLSKGKVNFIDGRGDRVWGWVRTLKPQKGRWVRALRVEVFIGLVGEPVWLIV